jgi:putative membrane protein
MMRWIHIIIVVLFVAAIAVFALQNLGAVTMTFLGFSVRAPLAVLVAVVYVLGMVTGGSLFSLLRRSIEGSKLMS